MRRLGPLPALLFLAAACGGGDEAPDAAVAPDAAADAGVEIPDVGVPDSGLETDAGPPPDSGVRWATSSCADCETGCEGGLCLTNQQNESFCSDACDGDRGGCADGFTCADIGDGQLFCIPPGATCAFDETGFGTSCYGSTDGCLPSFDHCEGDRSALGYCTRRCFNEYECPNGYSCLPGDALYDVCRATYLAPAETCARHPESGEQGCALDVECGEGQRCLRTDPGLPGVCAATCDGGCGEGTTCQPTPRGELCLSEACGCHATVVPEGTRDLLQEALSSVELTRCGAIFDIFDWTSNPADLLFDPYRLSWFDRVHNQPLDSPAFARDVVADLDAATVGDTTPAAQAAQMVTRLAALVDRDATPHAAATPDPSTPLVTAMVDLIEAADGTPDRAAIEADAADLPLELRTALARLVDAVRLGYLAQRAAVTRGRTREDLFAFGPRFIAPSRDGRALNAASANIRDLLNDGIGYGELYGAGVDALTAIAQADLPRFAAAPMGAGTATATFVFNQETPVGRIAVGDAESGVYDPRAPGMDGAWALLVDLGGDDAYRVPAGGNQSHDNPVSLLLDLGGDDVYGYVTSPAMGDEGRLPADADGRYQPSMGPDEDNGPISLSDVARQGAGRMGVGVLVDMGAGEDHYQSLRLSQGVGVFGVGVLIDEGGDDVYLAEAASQGAGAFGIGILFDVGGDDVRRAYTMSQGFAFARAAGLVYDVDGDDQYLMDVGDPSVGGDPLYLSAQRPGRSNATLGQGFAFGRRADFSDRAFMSGGVGLLVDARGRDRYEGSIFAQGGGFWFGTGILADHDGDDTYDALWYAMGTGAHYALGFLLEGGGDDVYGGMFPRVNVTIAGAHDYTAAFLIDESGNDTYLGSRITMGSGNLNGFGVFVDNDGDDLYESRSPYGVGAAGLLEGFELGSARRRVQTVGLFVDAGGADTYRLENMDPFTGRGDDSAWVAAQNEDPLVNLVELGAGVDGEGESTLHAR